MEKVLFIEPYYDGSHKYFADGLKKNYPADIDILSLPGYNWKWRMEGGAIELAEKYKNLKETYTKIICSSMLDLPTFLALTNIDTSKISIILYFHENQFAYPVKEAHNADYHYSFISYKSALVADKLFFNSNYNYQTFFSGLEDLLKRLPKHEFSHTLSELKKKSKIVPIGFDTNEFNIIAIKETDLPIILWNHRWEYDKNPDLFFQTLIKLKNDGHQFELVVLGKQSNHYPPIFDKAKEILKNEILFWGFCDSRSEYLKWVKKSNLLPITSNQDFFGISLIEAIILGVYPLVPNRLAYPEHIRKNHANYIFKNDSDFYDRLKNLIIEIPKINLKDFKTDEYKWTSVIQGFLEV